MNLLASRTNSASRAKSYMSLKKIVYLGVFLALAITPLFVYGATFKGDKSYYLEPSVVVNDNLYTAGGNINVAGQVAGDLFTFGGNIMMTGPVSGDITAAGGTLNITSKVDGDVRVAGGNVIISNSINGDLLVAGGQINVMPGFTVGKDVVIAGENVSFEGSAARNVDIKGNTVYINSPIAGNLSVAAREIKLGPNALIQGNFDYSAPSEAVLAQGATIHGATNFKKNDMPAKGFGNMRFMPGLMCVAGLVKLIMIFTAALVMMYFFKNQTNTIVEKSISGFWKEALRGFIVLVVVPIAVILSFITVIGAFLGIIGILFYISFIIIASVISVLLFAKLSLKYLFKKDNYKLNWWVVAISTLVFGIVSMIPFVGWIFSFIIFISALGSTSAIIHKKLVS